MKPEDVLTGIRDAACRHTGLSPKLFPILHGRGEKAGTVDVYVTVSNSNGDVKIKSGQAQQAKLIKRQMHIFQEHRNAPVCFRLRFWDYIMNEDDYRVLGELVEVESPGAKKLMVETLSQWIQELCQSAKDSK